MKILIWLFSICYIIIGSQTLVAQQKLDKIWIDESTIMMGTIVSENTDIVEFKDIEMGKTITLFKKTIFKIVHKDGKEIIYKQQPKVTSEILSNSPYANVPYSDSLKGYGFIRIIIEFEDETNGALKSSVQGIYLQFGILGIESEHGQSISKLITLTETSGDLFPETNWIFTKYEPIGEYSIDALVFISDTQREYPPPGRRYFSTSISISDRKTVTFKMKVRVVNDSKTNDLLIDIFGGNRKYNIILEKDGEAQTEYNEAILKHFAARFDPTISEDKKPWWFKLDGRNSSPNVIKATTTVNWPYTRQ